MGKRFLTVDETAKLLGFSKSYLYQLLHKRLLPHYKLNRGKVLFDADEIEAVVRRGKVATVDEIQAKADSLLIARGRK
jgi:excisionase family DNA binding protein